MKILKKMVAIFAVTAMILGLTACGQSASADVTGNYPIYAIEAEGYCMLAEDYYEGSIELKADGKATITLDGSASDLEYKVSGETITFTSDGESQDATISNGVIKLDMDGDIAYFASEKADTSKIEALTMDEILEKMVLAEAEE